MRVTVLGGSGAWPSATQPCSGFLLEHDGFLLLVDAGYSVLPALLARAGAEQVDAVFISHGHPDHCSDLNPLLRARALRRDPAPPLTVHAPYDALDAVLALDRPGMLDAALDRRDFAPGDSLAIGPFSVRTALLPHWRPNAAARFTAGGASLVYTGDGGPDPALTSIAADADALIAEATHLDADLMPASEETRFLNSARHVGRQASQAGVGRLVLTHLEPGVDPAGHLAAAADGYSGRVELAVGGLGFDI